MDIYKTQNFVKFFNTYMENKLNQSNMKVIWKMNNICEKNVATNLNKIICILKLAIQLN